MVALINHLLTSLLTVHECDRQTDGKQTDGQIYDD